MWRASADFNEITVLMVHPSDEDVVPKRSVVVRDEAGALHKVDETHRSFDALHFVLLMPYGDDSWKIGLGLRPLCTQCPEDEEGNVFPIWDADRKRWCDTEGWPAPMNLQPKTMHTHEKEGQVSCRGCTSKQN